MEENLRLHWFCCMDMRFNLSFLMQEGCTLLFCSAKLSSAPREKLNGESWREKDETSINYSVSVNVYVCLKV